MFEVSLSVELTNATVLLLSLSPFLIPATRLSFFEIQFHNESLYKQAAGNGSFSPPRPTQVKAVDAFANLWLCSLRHIQKQLTIVLTRNPRVLSTPTQQQQQQKQQDGANHTDDQRATA